MSKRLISLLLALVMILSMVPMTVFAEEAAIESEETTEVLPVDDSEDTENIEE